MAESEAAVTVVVEFTVHVKGLHPYDNVFVVGSNKKIGSWVPENALELAPATDGPLNFWTNKITISFEEAKKPLRYRYFVGYYLQGGADPSSKKKIVSKWESNFLPRTIMSGIYMKTGQDEFGFYNGKSKLSNGWLHQPNLCEALLRFHGNALKFFKERYNERTFFIKVVPFDLRHKEIGSLDDDDEDESCETPCALPQLPSYSNIEVADLTAEDPHFRDPYIHGERYRNGSKFYVFRTKTVAADYLAFRFEFYADPAKKSKSSEPQAANQVNGRCKSVETSNGMSTSSGSNSDSEVERIAIAYCLPTSMPETFGKFSVPILAKNQQPIGLLTVDYLTAKALNPLLNQTMEVSFSKHWKKRVPLEIGHRGSGNSYTKFAAARENTVHSLNRAAKNGADFVELDVQLTKDRVAVIFHDFHVLVSVAKRSNSMMDLKNLSAEDADAAVTDFHELAVKDLRLNQLRLLHLNHHAAPENKDKLKVTTNVHEDKELEPFPTLVDALNNVHLDTGFNIEVKYPLEMKDGKHECENYFERNGFIDIILNDVYTFAGNRRIVFSSFDPDMATLIALKQHKYPVLFLSMGETKKYTPFVDERTCTSTMAVNFACSQDILGVNLHAEDVLKDTTPVIRAKQRKDPLVCFVWGDDLDNRENVIKMRELGMDGIIYDRIGEVEARKNVFVCERNARNNLFSVSPGPSRSGSLDKNSHHPNSFPHSLDIAVPTNGLSTAHGSGSSNSSNGNTRAASPTSPKKSGRFNEI